MSELHLKEVDSKIVKIDTGILPNAVKIRRHVIPAKAGIHFKVSNNLAMDCGVRHKDGSSKIVTPVTGSANEMHLVWKRLYESIVNR